VQRVALFLCSLERLMMLMAVVERLLLVAMVMVAWGFLMDSEKYLKIYVLLHYNGFSQILCYLLFPSN
jgi:hypothetical protein